MNLELNKKQFRRLLDMVYIGNWILNSTRGDQRFRDYDEVESLLFGKAAAEGMPPWPSSIRGRLSPPAPLWKAVSTRPLWSMRTTSFLIF